MSNLLLFGTLVASTIPRDWSQAKSELCLLETLPLDTRKVVGVISWTPSCNWTRTYHVTCSKRSNFRWLACVAARFCARESFCTFWWRNREWTPAAKPQRNWRGVKLNSRGLRITRSWIPTAWQATPCSLNLVLSLSKEWKGFRLCGIRQSFFYIYIQLLAYSR